MKHFTPFFILLLFSFSYLGFGQSSSGSGAKTSSVSAEYDRNAITVLVLDNNSEFNQDLKNASRSIVVPSKFDDNLLETRYIKAVSLDSIICDTLINQGIPNDILAKWFSRKDNGEFDMSIIHERGMYNATDDEVVKASVSKIGLAKLKDAGESLINRSYILVLEFNKIEDIQKKSEAGEATKKALAKKMGTSYEPTKNRKNGWVGEVKAYLYKMNFNDSVMGVFYNDIWIYEDDSPEIKAAKKAKFDITLFPLVSVIEVNATADGSQYNAGEFLAPPVQLTRDELFTQMINTGLGNVVFEIERKREEFRVKAPLYGTSPLKAKIGKKEGLYTEQRFFVFEFEQNRKGQTVAKRKGVIRTKAVTDNREVATGQSDKFSTFYQTAGRGLMEGMLMQQRNDFGLGISGGTSILGEMGGIYLKAEANVGAMTGRIVDLGLVQWKVFGTVHFQTKEYYLKVAPYDLNIPYDMNFTRFQVGISKGWHFARYFSIAPFASYCMETATNEDWIDDFNLEEGQNIGSDYLNFGIFGSINLAHWMQIVGGVNMYTLIGDAYDKDRASLNYKYTDYFSKREGMSIDVGLRIEF